MRAATWTGDHRLAIASIATPEPAPGRTLVRVHGCGICGTDLHLFRGEFMPAPGSVPGHEIAGVVEASDTLPTGTPVAVEPTMVCMSCPTCREGVPNRCANLRLLGISANGGAAEFVSVPSANVHPLPAGIDPVLGSLAEPLAVAVRGVHLANQPLGGRAIVLGAGTIGLMTLLVLRATFREVAVTGRYPHQRELALKLGATAAFEPGSKDLRAWAKDHPADVVFETVGGHADTLAEAMTTVRGGGTVVALGVFTGDTAIPGLRLVNEEIRLIGSVMYGRAGQAAEFGIATNMLASLRDDLPLLQTATFPLERANDAFEAASDKSRLTTKVTILPAL